jgi:hypothetical protein
LRSSSLVKRDQNFQQDRFAAAATFRARRQDERLRSTAADDGLHDGLVDVISEVKKVKENRPNRSIGPI